MKLECEGNTIEFTIEYRKRRTFEIRVIPPGIVKVIAPKEVRNDAVINIVKSKAGWIIRKLSEIREIESKRCIREYVSGENFMYLGNNFPLEVVTDGSISKPHVALERHRLLLVSASIDRECVRSALQSWYRQKAADKIAERVEYYRRIVGVKPNIIRIKDQKKRWGSCSSRGNLNFNWRCIMAPLEVLDYIVIHELCHLVHLNHSSEYWALLRRIMPDFQKHRDWLRINGASLEL